MALKVTGTFDIRDDDFKKTGQVVGIYKRTKSIEVDVCGYSPEDLKKIWDIIGDRKTSVEVTDLQDGILYRCDVYGTLNLFSGGDVAYFNLRIISTNEMADEDDDDDQ